jgi:diacylglycerol kinase family enzyme
MKAFILVNARAGSIEPKGPRALTYRISEACRSAGLEADVRTVPGEELTRAVEKAAASTADVVVLGGGDGTLSAGLPALVAAGKPLGVLPLGTLNHFAKDLGVPLEIEAAVCALRTGMVREVDLGEINGRLFLNNVSLGFYPEIVRDRESQEHREGRAHWPAMIRAAWKTLRRFPLVRVRLRTAERSWKLTTPFVFVGNNRYETRLLAVARRPRLDEGELWVYVARETDRAGLVRLGLRALLSRLDGARDFETWATDGLQIESHRPRVRGAVDGEIEDFDAPLRCRIRPRALRVIAPAAAG